MKKIKVLNADNKILSWINVNHYLDKIKNGHPIPTSEHRGITKLKKASEFILITGYNGIYKTKIITPYEAYKEILESGNQKLFVKYPELRKYRNE